MAKSASKGSLTGTTFLFTGTLQELTRVEAEKLVKDNGGSVLSGVTEKLNYLVVGEDAGSKLEKARKIKSIKVLTEKEFLKMVKGSGKSSEAGTKTKSAKVSAKKAKKVSRKSTKKKSSGLEVPYSDIRYGVIDFSGNICVACEYDEVSFLGQDLWLVRLDREHGVINQKGRIIVPVNYDQILFEDELLFTELNDNKGVYDLNGKKILEDEFSSITYSNGFLLVVKDSRYGVFTLDGKQRLPLKFDSISFDENIFLTQFEHVYQYYDLNGRLLINQKFIEAGSFTGGIAAVKTGNEFFFIDSKGTTLFTSDCDTVRDLEYGFIAVKKNQKWGLLDKAGKLVLPVQYDNIRIGSNWVIITEEDLMGVLNHSMQIIINPLYDDIYWKENGFVVIKDDQYGVCDPEGKLIIPCKFSDITLREKFYEVSESDKYGAFDLKGHELLPVKYDKLKLISFSNDYFFEVSESDKIGLFNFRGDEILPVKYEELSFSEKSVWATLDDHESVQVFNASGKLIAESKYDRIWQFSDGMAIVKLDGKFGYIGTDGGLIIPIDFDNAKDFNNGLAIVSKENKYGVIDKNGNFIIPNVYDSILVDEMGENFKIQKGTEYGVLNTKGISLIPLSSYRIDEIFGSLKSVIIGKPVPATVLIDQINTFIINENNNQFTLGYNRNAYVAEEVAGVVSDDAFLSALNSGQSWSSYAWDNNWYDFDNIYHSHGIKEPATDLKLPDGTIKEISLLYTMPEDDNVEDCFNASSKGQFVQMAKSDEKAYGWDSWKKHTITFDDLGNYKSPLLNVDAMVSGVEIKGVFDVRKIKVSFEGPIVESYTYLDDGLSFEEDEGYESTGQGFEADLYFNTGDKLIPVDLETLFSDLETSGVGTTDIEGIKNYLFDNADSF